MKHYEEEYAKVINEKYDKIEQVEDKIYQLKPSYLKGTGLKKDILESIFKTITTWP